MKTKNLLFLFLSFFAFHSNIFAQESFVKTYSTKPLSQEELIIDGIIDEQTWINSNWENDFTQYEPYDGEKPSQKTSFSILYDNNYIYIAFKAIDSSPDSIVQRMTRRDDRDGDLVMIQFDTYHDKRTAFSFTVSAAGIKSEFVISNDGNEEDSTWDPIWWVKTSKDNNGWYAEMKIPFSQLRFDDSDNLVWGLEVGRYLFRKDEWSLWQPISKDQSGWVSHYGEMKGLKNIKSKKTAEITPYVTARTDQFEKELDNPFKASGTRNKINMGLDGKFGLTKNLTLDFTINPDFGQVEADPSEVNLTTNETFFNEKRPFFIEGKNILNFPLMFGDGDLADENLFYSRRIGQKPHYEPELNDNEYVQTPEFASILGAAKITGKTKNGWSIGILESLTAKEYAVISDGTKRDEIVEPLANYIVGRLQKDFNNGNTILGTMLTGVNRNISASHLENIHKSAYTGGLDLVHKWDDKNWQINFSTYFSRVAGSTKAIQNTQESWIHNFQRPDATHLKLDTTKTSLTGTGGKFTISKEGGKLKFLHALTWKSPQLELNDVGYMRQADRIMQLLWVGYRIYEPFSIFRYYNINLNQWTNWNFAGESLGPGGNINMHTQFKNYWYLSLGSNLDGESLSVTQLRGGPGLKNPGSKNFWLSVNTNDQKKLTIGANVNFRRSNVDNALSQHGYGLYISYRPTNKLKIAVSPNYSKRNQELQYVTQEETSTKTDYIFSRINQNTLSASIRINYNITPDLSIQYWGQPFIATGKYNEFKYITDGRASKYQDRFQHFPNDQLSFNAIDESYSYFNEEGILQYEFDKPDFNVKEFLSNMVVRWEYSPGSTVYLVWSQTKNSSVSDGNLEFQRDWKLLFDEKPYNIFLVKLSYRIGR